MIVNLAEDQQRQHKNGGGYVALTAKVDDTVYVGKFAVVYGKAVVEGKVRILDFAQVSGTAHLSGDVVVSGNAWVDGNTKASTGTFSKNERKEEKATRIR